MKKIIIISFICLFVFNNLLFAHDDKNIHPSITQKAAQNSTFDVYLKNNLNFTDGINTKLPTNGKKVLLDWLKDGSFAEDSPMCRASNHFLDPIKSWDTAAMSDSPWWINVYCNSWSPYYSTVT